MNSYICTSLTYLLTVNRNKVHVGCSRTIKSNSLGCQPVIRPCNPVVLLQLSTNARAKQCYCDTNACNNPSDLFKIIFGGYLLVIIGAMGIIVNILGLGVLISIKKKTEIDITLTGILMI